MPFLKQINKIHLPDNDHPLLVFIHPFNQTVIITVINIPIITPTGDPFTLSVVAIPLYLLYEMSILMIKDKKKTEEEDEAGDEVALSEE